MISAREEGCARNRIDEEHERIARYPRRFAGFDEKIVSKHARGVTVGEPHAQESLAIGDDAVDVQRRGGDCFPVVLFGDEARVACRMIAVLLGEGERVDEALPKHSC